MIEIIEHKDYSKPVDNDTVIEIPDLGNTKTKLFKVFDGIWLNPTPTYKKHYDPREAITLPPYIKEYCKTIEQKSKYLEQMTILFKRINSTPLGQGLLTELHKGPPIDFSKTDVWSISNMVSPKTPDNLTNRKLRCTCIIAPMEGYLECVAKITDDLKMTQINTHQTKIIINPDCVYTLKRKRINYMDPAVCLFHELTHILHSTYGILGLTNKQEEYITFGSNDAQKLSRNNSNHYRRSRDILLAKLKSIKQKVSLITNLEDREIFENKYGFSSDINIDKKFVDNYIKRFQFTYTEYNFTKELNLTKTHRSSYKEKFFIPFAIDISDPKIYTVEKGFVKPSTTIKEIKKDSSKIMQNLDDLKTQLILKKCFGEGSRRSKRSLDFKIIPLEPLGEDLDKSIEVEDKYKDHPANEASRKKREVKECQEEITDLLEKLDTVYEKSTEIPGRLLGKHVKTKINNFPEAAVLDGPLEDMVLDTPSIDTGAKESELKLETFKVGELVGFDRVTPKDMLNAHRINHDLLEGEEPIYFTSDDFSTSTIAGNQSFTHNKNLSTKMNLMDKGKAVLKTGNAIVNIAQFGMWVDEIVEDFKGNTGKDNLHIANDVLSIVPYLGQVMNIGVDIKDGNYLGAVETLGILVLLEVFPELMLPVFLIGLIVNAIQKNKQQKEMVSKAVWNILMEREQLLDSQLETGAENLAHICIERIQKIADHIERSLTFNAEAIINNIKYHGKKITKNNEDHNKELEKIIRKSSVALYNTVQAKRNKVIETLFTQLKKTMFHDFKEKAKGEISQFNEQTKTMIKDMLKEHSKDISTSAVEEGLKVVEHYMRTEDIGKKIKHELDILIDILKQGINVIIHKTGNPLVYSHIGLNNNNKAVDKVTNKELVKQNISFKWGRNGNALNFKAGNSIQINCDGFRHTSVYNSFAIEFWIKVPSTQCKDRIVIISNGSNHKMGYHFVLKEGYLSFVLNIRNADNLQLGNYYVANNVWRKITVVNNLSLKELLFYIDGELAHSVSTYWISKNYANAVVNGLILIEVPKDKKDVDFSIDDFKVRPISLLPSYIKECYNKDIKLLYDIFGNCLKENREYVITIFDQYSNRREIVSKNTDVRYLVCDKKIPINDRHNHTVKINLAKKDDSLENVNESSVIKKNDNVFLTFYNDTDSGKDLRWAVNPAEKNNNYMIHINNEDKKLPNKHVVYSSNDKFFNTFKIFNMYDYAQMPLYSINPYSISLALYKEGILKSLIISHMHGILAVDGLLENNSSSDVTVKLPKAYPDVIRDYTYKALCFLVPINEQDDK